MSAVYAFISFGLYGAAMDPASGEVQLVARCKAIGVNVMGSPYQWSDIQLIVDQIMGLSLGVKIAVGGDSLGANEAPAIAQALVGKRDIDLLFGFQRSEYGVQVPVPHNVIKAINVYNPIWIETGGLGDDPWTLAPGNTRTKLITTPIEAAHPDDFGVAQDIVFNQIKALKS